ncbi:MAG: polysaccharide biosynthesis tyrosine autokinase [Ectothiorhodospiraceae bacterium]|nr:polysaccharide biosynthesis tyrosine autokinase [Ectothiorhodospiraceae bacterium]
MAARDLASGGDGDRGEGAARAPVHSLTRPGDTAGGRWLVTDPEPAGLGLSEAWRVLRRYRASVLALTVGGAVIGLGLAYSATPVYQADVKLLVKYSPPALTAFRPYEAAPAVWLFYETQHEIIRSRSIAERVVADMGLETPDTSPPAAPGRLGRWRDGVVDFLADRLPAEWRSDPGLAADGQARHAAALARVQGGLTVSGGKDSEIIVVGYRSPDPELAAAMAMAVARAYIGFGQESRRSTVREAGSVIDERVEALRRNVEASERALREFQARENLVDTASQEQLIGARMSGLTAELLAAQSRRREAELRYQQVRKLADPGASRSERVRAVDAAAVSDAQSELRERSRVVAELGQRYGEKHPRMIAARRELADAERRLGEELDKAVSRLVQGARRDYEVVAGQERDLRAMIDSEQGQMRAVSDKTMQLRALEADVAQNRKLYEEMLARSKEVELTGDEDVSNVRILDPARVPTTPVAPDKRRMVLLALLAGLALGLGLAFLRHYLDRTFRVREDVEERLGLPVLGVVPRARRGRRDRTPLGRLVLEQPQSAFAEAVNDVRTALTFTRVDDPPHVVLVTSALEGEGKTTLASNLALGLRERGRTLLLEADLRRGRLHAELGDGTRPGLSDVVAGTATLGDALQEDPRAPGLFVMTAGTAPPNPLEVLASRRFAAALDKLRQSFQHIVVDAAPLLPVSDAIVLGHLADAVVLVVQADRTTHPMAQDAVRRLAAAGLRPAGAVLQQVDQRRLREYGYGYAYGYSAYARGSASSG